MKISNKIYRDYIYKNEAVLRAQYDPELEFYTTIKSGDVEKAKELCLAKISEKEGLGELSDSPLQSLKYHFAITMAMLARYCIEGGLDLSTSYALSDFYIQEADRVSTMDELNTLHTTACLDYARRMKNLRKKKITSKPISKCLDYIYDHLHTRITLSRLAELTGLNSSYLSRLFHKETGMTVSDYIQQTKIETAKNMLLHSSYSAAEIASILAFSDQSYFSEVFKKQTGLTPKRYQSLNLNASGLPDR